ncbi:MAG: hypothetical protein FWG50_02645 [Kiritimatiellaeota bacterium]|nr:hypothetical protein [Kiritimatiellota bacterium]
MMKGDARDLDIVGDGFRDALAMRVAGTNIINYSPPSSGMPAGSGWRGCTPSVTNTGPQGLYVEAILRQYWEKMEERNTAKVPPELLTLAVWFDDGGNPVCNVDLAKYGLTMPELDVPNRPMGKSGVRDEESGVKSEKSGTRRLWSLALIIPAALTALLLARRRRR